MARLKQNRKKTKHKRGTENIKLVGSNFLRWDTPSKPTDGVSGVNVRVLLVGPRHHVDEIGHKRRNATLEDGRIAQYDVLFVDIRLVVLLDDCIFGGVEKK